MFDEMKQPMRIYLRMPNAIVLRDTFALVDEWGDVVENICSMEEHGDGHYVFETFEVSDYDPDDKTKGHVTTREMLHLWNVETIWLDADEFLPGEEGFEQQQFDKRVMASIDMVMGQIAERVLNYPLEDLPNRGEYIVPEAEDMPPHERYIPASSEAYVSGPDRYKEGIFAPYKTWPVDPNDPGIAFDLIPDGEPIYHHRVEIEGLDDFELMEVFIDGEKWVKASKPETVTLKIDLDASQAITNIRELMEDLQQQIRDTMAISTIHTDRPGEIVVKLPTEMDILGMRGQSILDWAARNV